MKVHTIDLRFQGVPGVIAASLLESGGEVALVEMGPGSTMARLCAGILERGVALERVNGTSMGADGLGLWASSVMNPS